LPDFINSKGHEVEALAQELYEASDPQGVPWVERSLIVRDPWLVVAKKRLAKPKACGV